MNLLLKVLVGGSPNATVLMYVLMFAFDFRILHTSFGSLDIPMFFGLTGELNLDVMVLGLPASVFSVYWY